jgi:hypothetical protein
MAGPDTAIGSGMSAAKPDLRWAGQIATASQHQSCIMMCRPQHRVSTVAFGGLTLSPC